MKKILIVEDSPTFRDLLCKALRKRGYEVIEVNSVFSALKEIQNNSIDFICTDYNLPINTGLDLLTNRLSRNIPTCIMSNSTDRFLPDNAKKMGAVEFLYKTDFEFLNDLCKCIENI